MSRFSGIWIPLVTPFDGGAVDHRALDALVRHYARAGVAGFVALGTTGEPAALDAHEQDAVLATVLAAAGALPVVVGVGGSRTAAVCERIAALDALPIAGVLAAAPYYIRPSQAGLVGHFAALADASRRPLILYDIPQRTGVRLELATLLELAAHERIVAVKDCAGSPARTLALIADGRLDVLCGEDAEMFGALCAGASGAIAASAHLWPARFVALERMLREDRLAEARALWRTLLPLVTALFAEPNPAPVKAALALGGLIRDGLRAPMTAAGDGLRRELAAIVG